MQFSDIQAPGDVFWLTSDHLDHLIRQIQQEIGPHWIREVPGPKTKMILLRPTQPATWKRDQVRHYCAGIAPSHGILRPLTDIELDGAPKDVC